MVFFGDAIISLMNIRWDFCSVIQVLCKPALTSYLNSLVDFVVADVGNWLATRRDGRDGRDNRYELYIFFSF